MMLALGRKWGWESRKVEFSLTSIQTWPSILVTKGYYKLGSEKLAITTETLCSKQVDVDHHVQV